MSWFGDDEERLGASDEKVSLQISEIEGSARQLDRGGRRPQRARITFRRPVVLSLVIQ